MQTMYTACTSERKCIYRVDPYYDAAPYYAENVEHIMICHHSPVVIRSVVQ